MSKLTKEAQDKPCMIRIPGVCSFDPDAAVLAHYSMSGLSGVGLKSPDMVGSWSCNRCHDVVDSRVKSNYSRETLRLMHAEGVFRTIAALQACGWNFTKEGK